MRALLRRRPGRRADAARVLHRRVRARLPHPHLREAHRRGDGRHRDGRRHGHRAGRGAAHRRRPHPAWRCRRPRSASFPTWAAATSSRAPGQLGALPRARRPDDRAADAIYAGLADAYISPRRCLARSELDRAAARPRGSVKNMARAGARAAEPSSWPRCARSTSTSRSSRRARRSWPRCARRSRPQLRDWAPRRSHALEKRSPTMLAVTLRAAAARPHDDARRLLPHGAGHGAAPASSTATSSKASARSSSTRTTRRAGIRHACRRRAAPRSRPSSRRAGRTTQHPLAHLGKRRP